MNVRVESKDERRLHAWLCWVLVLNYIAVLILNSVNFFHLEALWGSSPHQLKVALTSTVHAI